MEAELEDEAALVSEAVDLYRAMDWPEDTHGHRLAAVEAQMRSPAQALQALVRPSSLVDSVPGVAMVRANVTVREPEAGQNPGP